MPDEKRIPEVVSSIESEHFLELERPMTVDRAPREKQEAIERSDETVVPVIAPALAHSPLAHEKTALRLEIEQVLEEDLAYMYSQLSEPQRKQFREEGERVAERVEEMLSRAKIKLTEIIRLITDWLVLLPGVNRFFVEREAKIKAERLIHLSDVESL